MKLSPKEQEERFQRALFSWKENHDKASWNEMFVRVNECCKGIASKMIPFQDYQFMDKVNDATCYIMRKIQEGKEPQKLSSYCYWPVFLYCRGEKQIRIDRECDLSELDNYKYEINDGVAVVSFDSNHISSLDEPSID